uniref:Copia protein n=1 Tax=Cajanus cajan TaxID=3821 RepID=A0A151TZE1_CAJCA|nr:Copia protein [Cajanus cajan]
MVTRSQHGIVKPNPKYALITMPCVDIPRNPHNIHSALAHPGWKAAMGEELEALHKNQTWKLVPRTTIMHLKMVRRILRYVKATIDVGLHFTSNTTLDLFAFSDADWVGYPTTRRSITGYCTFLGGNPILWCAKKQHTVSYCSTKTEYRAMANTIAELTWLTFILKDLHISLASPPILYCYNISALHMTINPVFHACSKHIELDYHFVRERVSLGLLVTHYIPTNDQVADLFTKLMSKATFMHFQTKICLQPRPRLREGINRIEMSLDNNYDNHETQNYCKENSINYGSTEGEILEN